jgi:hypothetical protein
MNFFYKINDFFSLPLTFFVQTDTIEEANV